MERTYFIYPFLMVKCVIQISRAFVPKHRTIHEASRRNEQCHAAASACESELQNQSRDIWARGLLCGYSWPKRTWIQRIQKELEKDNTKGQMTGKERIDSFMDRENKQTKKTAA